MRIFDSFLTVVVFVPFSVLVLYYFFVIIKGTIRDREKLNNWVDYVQLLGIMLLQIGGVGLTGLLLYIIFFEGVGL